MPTQKTSNSFFSSTLNKALIAGLLVLTSIFILSKLKIISSEVQAPDPDSYLTEKLPPLKVDLNDFSLWEPETVENLPFTFFLPKEWSVNALEGYPGNFNIFGKGTPSKAQLFTFSYEKLAAQQQSLSKSGHEKFGWTNAYGMSIFEHRDFKDEKNKVLVAFVVNTHTNDVLSFTVVGDENIQILQKAFKTMNPVRAEDDKSLRVFADFQNNYLFKYPAYFKPNSAPNSIFSSIVNLDADNNVVTFTVMDVDKDTADNPDQLSLLDKLFTSKPSDSFTQGSEGTFTVLRSFSINGVSAVTYQADNGFIWSSSDSTEYEKGLILFKDHHYIVIKYAAVDKKDLNNHSFEMSQLFNSVRMLTEQEKIQ